MSGVPASEVRVVLVDINPKMIKAWKETFEGNPEVQVIEGSMLAQDVDAWVSPTNSAANMDGGLDGVIKNLLGAQIQTRVHAELKARYQGKLPLGHALCVVSGRAIPRFLISTPTMVASSEDVGASLNTALACAAAFQAVRVKNRETPGAIKSVALPGLGANTGRVPVEVCADLMWTAYNIFRTRDIADQTALRAALESELGDLSPMKGQAAIAQPIPKASTSFQPKPPAPPPPPPAPKAPQGDFDDF